MFGYGLLKWAQFERAQLRGTKFFCADLEGANLKGADLFGANLFGANLAGANLAGANLSKVEVDKETEWPLGFDPEAAGVIID